MCRLKSEESGDPKEDPELSMARGLAEVVSVVEVMVESC